MKTAALSLLLALAFGPLRADDISVNLVPPATQSAPGADLAIDVLWLNHGAPSQQVLPPPAIDATLRQAQSSWPVRLREADASASGALTVERGGFAQRTYLLTLPAGVSGAATLSIEQPFTAGTMIDIAPSAVAAAPAPGAGSIASVPALRPVAGRLHRTVVENFGFHEPIYFLYGGDEPAAKFQFSFRYRLAGHRDSPIETDPADRGLYFAYTQRSLWNIQEPSSPFYDTSYMPELMFESLALERPGHEGGVNFLGYQTGYRHESNGKDGLDSRSLNIVYVRSGVMIGRRDGWRALVVPRVFAYLGNSSDNDDIADYRGHGELLLSLGREDGIQVNLTGIAGQDWDKGSVQMDATYPIQITTLNFDTYLHIQYFDGYGESLKDYDRKTSTWRAGISLVR